MIPLGHMKLKILFGLYSTLFQENSVNTMVRFYSMKLDPIRIAQNNGWNLFARSDKEIDLSWLEYNH